MKITFYIILCSLLVGCNPLSILGPSGKPDFDKKSWESMEIQYWIKTGESKKEERKFVISSSKTTQSLLSKLNIERIEGYSLGVSEQIILSLVDGSQWDMKIVFADRIDFGLREDKYYAYNVFTEDNVFFDALKDLCFENAKMDF